MQLKFLLCLRYTGLLISMLMLSFFFAPSWGYSTANASAKTSSADLQAETAHTSRTATSYAGGVYLDTNQNGTWDLNEEGMEDVSVRLETIDGDIFQTATSDEEGYYLFEDLPTGEFRVRIQPPRGYHITTNGTFTISTIGVSGPVLTETGLSQSQLFYLPLLTASSP